MRDFIVACPRSARNFPLTATTSRGSELIGNFSYAATVRARAHGKKRNYLVEGNRHNAGQFKKKNRQGERSPWRAK